jgi:hypothetical protein
MVLLFGVVVFCELMGFGIGSLPVLKYRSTKFTVAALAMSYRYLLKLVVISDFGHRVCVRSDTFDRGETKTRLVVLCKGSLVCVDSRKLNASILLR